MSTATVRFDPALSTERRAQLQAAWDRGGRGAPAPPSLQAPKLTYTDPGKPRPDVGIDALTAMAVAHSKNPGGDDPRCLQMIGRRIVGDYCIQATNGHVAVAELAEPSGAYANDVPMYAMPTGLVTLTPDVWRWYAPVRPFRNPRSHAIRWTVELGPVGNRTLVLSAAGDQELGDGKSTIPVVCTDGSARETVSIILSDQYAWPLRGGTWAFGITGKNDAAVFVAGARAVVVMGMRE